MNGSRQVDLIALLTILVMTVAGLYSLAIDRYLFWFPEWFVLSIQKGIAFDIPRYSFSLFQFPSYLLGLFKTQDYVRIKSIGSLLTLYPIISFAYCWKLIRETKSRFFIYPLALLFLSFYFIISAPGFNGALHSFALFWVLASLLIKDKTKSRFFLFLYPLFLFFYPPAAFMGSVVLLAYLYKNNQRDKKFMILSIGALVSLGYLIGFKFFSEYPIYSETILGFKATVFSSLSCFYYLLCFYIWRFPTLGVKTKNFLFSLVLLFGFYLFENWNEGLLSNQYYFRMYSYTLGFAPLLLINSYSKLEDFNRLALNSFAFFSVLFFLADIRASYHFQQDLKLLDSISKEIDSNKRCIEVPLPSGLRSNYEDINSLSFLLPSINSSEFILLPIDKYTNGLFKSYCL